MYLLDTNHCSRIMEGDPVVIAQLKAHTGQMVATSVISRGELVFMARKSERVIANTNRVENFLSGIKVLSIDEGTASVYGEIKAALVDKYGPQERAKRRRVSIADLGFGENDIWIASLSIRHRFVLVTSDADFRRIHEAAPLMFETWWKPKSP